MFSWSGLVIFSVVFPRIFYVIFFFSKFCVIQDWYGLKLNSILAFLFKIIQYLLKPKFLDSTLKNSSLFYIFLHVYPTLQFHLHLTLKNKLYFYQVMCVHVHVLACMHVCITARTNVCRCQRTAWDTMELEL